jgi:hypothetical protein
MHPATTPGAQTSFPSLLRYNPVNPRYFADASGRAVYLSGSHTWATLVEIQGEGDPDFDWLGFLDMAQAHGHNFMRLWTWDHPLYAPWTDDRVTFDPLPFARTGPGVALDGLPKFDLTQFNPIYFERLRQRVVEAGRRGIYVAVMLFEGWSLKWSVPTSDAWRSHPFHRENNINGVDGDPDGDGKGDVYALESPAVLEHQQGYVRQVIDAVNEFDHVLYEIINEVENTARGFQWQEQMIDFVRAVERGKPKQHPIGNTGEGGSQLNPVLFASRADWISPGNGPNRAYRYDPPVGDGSKVILADTDHLWGHGGNYRWAWKCFLRGLNPLFMDPWGPVPGRTRAGYAGAILNQRDYPTYEPLRQALGATRRVALRLDLNRMLPRPDFASSGYCLADPGVEYLVYVPDDDRVEVYVGIEPKSWRGEWRHVLTGESTAVAPVSGGGLRHFTSPFGLDSLLYLTARPEE